MELLSENLMKSCSMFLAEISVLATAHRTCPQLWIDINSCNINHSRLGISNISCLSLINLWTSWFPSNKLADWFVAFFVRCMSTLTGNNYVLQVYQVSCGIYWRFINAIIYCIVLGFGSDILSGGAAGGACAE